MCLLVSTKTRSSGIINKLVPRAHVSFAFNFGTSVLSKPNFDFPSFSSECLVERIHINFIRWLIGTKHFHKYKTLPQITKHLHKYKTLAQIQNTCTNTKHLHKSQNTCTNHKTLAQITKHLHKSQNTCTNHKNTCTNTKHLHKSQNTCTNTKHLHKSQNTCTNHKTLAQIKCFVFLQVFCICASVLYLYKCFVICASVL